MTTLRQAAQQALEALDGLSEDAVCQSSHHAKKDHHTSLDVCPVFLRLRAAITALRAALAEPVQEPVAFVNADNLQGLTLGHYGYVEIYTYESAGSVSLYTAPPQRKPLTDEEIKAKAMEAFNSYWDGDDETLVNKYGHGVYMSRFTEFARAIEAAHGIKEQT